MYIWQEQIAKAMREAAEKRGFSSAWAAMMIGVNQRTVDSWLAGDRLPLKRYWKKIEKIYRIKFSDFLEYEDVEEKRHD